MWKARQVHGLDRITGNKMENVEALGKAQQIAEILIGAGAPSPVQIRYVGRAGDGAEIDVVAAQHHAMGRVAGVKHEFGRGVGDVFFDQATVEAHHLARPVDIGAGGLEAVKGGVGQYLEAEFFEDL